MQSRKQQGCECILDRSEGGGNREMFALAGTRKLVSQSKHGFVHTHSCDNTTTHPTELQAQQEPILEESITRKSHFRAYNALTKTMCNLMQWNQKTIWISDQTTHPNTTYAWDGRYVLSPSYITHPQKQQTLKRYR